MTKKKIEIYLFHPDANKNNVVGDRLLVDWTTKNAYVMGDKTDLLVNQISVVKKPDVSYWTFMKENNLHYTAVQPSEVVIQKMLSILKAKEKKKTEKRKKKVTTETGWLPGMYEKEATEANL